VTPGAEQVPLGLSQQLTATVTYTDGSTEDVTPRVTWSSSDPRVMQMSMTSGAEGIASALRTGSTIITATLGTSAGVVTGVASGSATLFGTLNGLRASAKVTVQP
jgi:uncharacterized protein YjdB